MLLETVVSFFQHDRSECFGEYDRHAKGLLPLIRTDAVEEQIPRTASDTHSLQRFGQTLR